MVAVGRCFVGRRSHWLVFDMSYNRSYSMDINRMPNITAYTLGWLEIVVIEIIDFLNSINK